MADVPFIDMQEPEGEKGQVGKSLLEALMQPKMFLGFIVLLGACIFASELCIMFLLEHFPIESPLLEAVIDASLLMSIITPALLLIYQRPGTKLKPQGEGSASARLSQANEMPHFLLNARRVVSLVVLLGITIFSGEVLVMLMLIALPVENPLVEAVVDSALLVLVISPALIFLFYRPVRSRVRALSHSRRRISALSERLMQLAEEEQRRLALDLHDEFGQTLSAMRLEVDSLKSGYDDSTPEVVAIFASLEQRINEMRDSVHHIARRLRPSTLDDLGIGPALEGLISDFENVHKTITFDLLITGLKARPCSKIETAIYRICQEAVTNAIKHAQPQHVQVRLTACYPELIVVIQDDGSGFEPEQIFSVKEPGKHLGILGMRERAQNYGGNFTVSSRLGEGTKVRVVFPARESDHEIDA